MQSDRFAHEIVGVLALSRAARSRRLLRNSLGRHQRPCYTDVVSFCVGKLAVNSNTAYVGQAMFLDAIKTRYQALGCAPTRLYTDRNWATCTPPHPPASRRVCRIPCVGWP